ACVDGSKIAVVAHPETRRGQAGPLPVELGEIDTEVEPGRVVGCERPIAPAIPGATSVVVLLFEVGVRKEQVACRVVDARIDPDVIGVGVMDRVLEPVPLPVGKPLRRSPASDGIGVAAAVDADDKAPAGAAAVL